MFDQYGGGGFPVGAGHPHHRHFFRRTAKPVGGDHRQRPPGGGDHHIGDIPLGWLLTDNAGCASVHCLCDKAAAVALCAGNGDKEVAGCGGSGIIADTQNLRRSIGADGCDLYIAK